MIIFISGGVLLLKTFCPTDVDDAVILYDSSTVMSLMSFGAG